MQCWRFVPTCNLRSGLQRSEAAASCQVMGVLDAQTSPLVNAFSLQTSRHTRHLHPKAQRRTGLPILGIPKLNAQSSVENSTQFTSEDHQVASCKERTLKSMVSWNFSLRSQDNLQDGTSNATPHTNCSAEIHNEEHW